MVYIPVKMLILLGSLVDEQLQRPASLLKPLDMQLGLSPGIGVLLLQVLVLFLQLLNLAHQVLCLFLKEHELLDRDLDHFPLLALLGWLFISLLLSGFTFLFRTFAGRLRDRCLIHRGLG